MVTAIKIPIKRPERNTNVDIEIALLPGSDGNFILEFIQALRKLLIIIDMTAVCFLVQPCKIYFAGV